MKNILYTSLLACVLLVGFSSCTKDGADKGNGACSVLNAKVFNGDSCSNTAQTPVVAVIPVLLDGTQITIAGICTGALVTVDDVVTSAHCFADPIREYGTQNLRWAIVVGGAEDGDAIPVVNYSIHPNYDGQVGSPYDVAIATLSHLPFPEIGPLPIATSESTGVGDIITTFGYGTSNRGEIGELKAADILVEGLQDGNIFASTEVSGASICQGDSGGPAVKIVGGVPSLVGINSFGTAESEECSAQGAEFYGFVNIQNEGILSFLKAFAPDIPVS